MRFLPRIDVKRKAPDGARLPQTSFVKLLTPERTAVALARKGHSIIEFLDQDSPPGKLYFDVDKWIEPPGRQPTEDEVAAFELEVRHALDAIRDTIATAVTHDVTYVLAQRHGAAGNRHKLSLRAFFSGTRIHHWDIPELVRVVRFNGVSSRYLMQLFDMTVYKRTEQLMCAILGRKGGKDARVLTPLDPLPPEDPGSELLKYVIQHVDPEWEAASGFAQAAEEGGCVREAGMDLDTAACDDSILQLVRCLGPSTASDRDKWVRVGIVLRHALGGGSDRYLPAFLEFSRKAGPTKYKGDDDCEKTWRSLRPRGPAGDGARSLSIGTLCMLAKQDSFELYKAWRAQAADAQLAPLAAPRPAVQCDPDAARTCTHVMLCALGEPPGALESADNAKADEGRFTVDARIVDGRVLHLRLDIASLRVTEHNAEGAALRSAFIHHKDPIDVVSDRLNSMHKGLQPEWAWQVTRPDDGCAVFTTKHGPMAKINLRCMDEKDKWARLELQSATPLIIKDNKRLDILHDVYNSAVSHKAMHGMGMTWLSVVGDNNMINIITMPAAATKDADKLTDEELVRLVASSHPDTMRRIKYKPDFKSSNCNGVYYCDPATNLWAQKHNAFLEQRLLELVSTPDVNKHLSDADRRHVQSRRGRADVLYCLISKCLDDTFCVDNNLDVFPMDDGVYDMTTRTFREVMPEDRISITTGWSYDPDAAREHRPDLDAFLAQVMPLPDERNVVLAFIAQALCGHRTTKKMLALTDRRSGNNGKTTLVALLEVFFGANRPTRTKLLAKSTATTKLLCKSAYDRGRDAHDEGLNGYCGTRVVVADELSSNMTLDDSFIKLATDGGRLYVDGRGCGTAERFTYTWQAMIIVLFNEGMFPKFDVADRALTERILIAPMHSKFVPAHMLQAGNEPYMHLADPSIHDKFPKWRSAMLDLLLQKFASVLPPIPASMTEWQANFVAQSNPFTNWLQDNVLVTGDPSHRFALAELVGAVLDVDHLRKDTPPQRIPAIAKAYLTSLPGVEIKNARLNGHPTHNVVIGAQFAFRRGPDFLGG